MRPFVLGNYEDTGRILVDSVHQTGPHIAVAEQRQILQMIGQRVDQRSRIVPVTGMHHHAGRLVDDNQVVVFVTDVQRYVFRNDLHFPQRIGHHDRYPIQRFDFITRLDGHAVHQDITGVRRRLNPVPRSAFHPVSQELVDSQQVLSFVDRHAVVFVHLLRRVRPVGQFGIVPQQILFVHPDWNIYSSTSFSVAARLSANSRTAFRASRSDCLRPASSFLSSRVSEKFTFVPSVRRLPVAGDCA